MPERKTRTRRDPRREATRVALIEKAEALIASHGVEGVSTRQIGAAIGSANNNVVAYHFGGKEELVKAIYHHRLPAVEARREELLARLDARGTPVTLYELLHAVWLPLYEQTDEQGRHSYLAFLAGLARSGWVRSRGTMHDDYPVVGRIVQRMQALMPEPLRAAFHTRLIAIAAMLTNAIASMDDLADTPEGAGKVFEDLLRMAAAALLAPAPSGD